jgi:alkylated DNA repair dioxygenase AlkB
MASTSCPQPVSPLVSHSAEPPFKPLVRDISNLRVPSLQMDSQISDVMATPTTPTRGRTSSTDSSIIDGLAILNDDDSALSNSRSSISRSDDHASTQDGDSTETQSTAGVKEILFDRGLYGSASLQRPRRVRQAPVPFSLPTPPKKAKKVKKVKKAKKSRTGTTSNSDWDQASSTDGDEPSSPFEHSSGAEQRSVRKRKLKTPYEAPPMPRKPAKKAIARKLSLKQQESAKIEDVQIPAQDVHNSARDVQHPAKYVQDAADPPPTSTKRTVRTPKRKAQAPNSDTTPPDKRAKTSPEAEESPKVDEAQSSRGELTQPSYIATPPTEVEDTQAMQLLPVAPADIELAIASREAATAHLRTVVDRLFAHRKLDVVKPEPAGRPEVWADGRQELCESLHYYRSYQGACYCTGGFVRAFMFDKVAHARDYMDSNVVISRAGGSMMKDKDSGEMKSSRDQSNDTTTVQALKNCTKHYNPLVIITGVDNPHTPSKPPHQYCVLDYFKPTYVWVEKSGNSKILRYRFEKLNTKKESWWRAKDQEDPVELGELGNPVEETCSCCGVESLQIYLNGWMCLQPTCAAFWRVFNDPSPGSSAFSYEPEEASLVYDPRFLKQKTPWPNDDHEYPLATNSPELSAYSIPGENTSQAFWSGMVCPDCGRCNSRLSWLGWDCQNSQCNFRKMPPHSLIPATALREPFWPLTDSYTLSRDVHSPLIEAKISFAHGYRINQYTVPGLDGFITHMIANKTVIEETGGPDAMFEELQQTDIDLRRRMMPGGQLKGDSYCRHFTVNYGMPYKFIASAATHSFEGAARPITETRSRLNWAAKYLLTQTTSKTVAEVSEEWNKTEFNEVLALGYFEQQRINYHDDGEDGLGPTIATLSLGAPGVMRIRMKARHYHGASSAGMYDEARPLPGCQQYEARAALQPDLDALKQSDPRAYRARLKQIPTELRLKSSGHAKDVLTMELGHGDIVFMHGAELQKYYEHSVSHTGKLRFALTCRYIDPESIEDEDRPEYVVGPDEGGYDGSKVGM